MAILVVTYKDIEAVAEAGVCMRCGEPAEVVKAYTFAWFPPRIFVLLILCGPIPFLIVALAMTARKKMRIPFCAAHRDHLLWRQLITALGLFELFAYLLLACVQIWTLIQARVDEASELLGGLLCLILVPTFLIWLLAVALARTRLIRASGITSESIVLTNVSDDFESAMSHFGLSLSAETEGIIRQRWGDHPPSPPQASGDVRIQRGTRDDEQDSPPDAIRK